MLKELIIRCQSKVRDPLPQLQATRSLEHCSCKKGFCIPKELIIHCRHISEGPLPELGATSLLDHCGCQKGVLSLWSSASVPPQRGLSH